MAGDGDTGNAAFAVVGNEVRTAGPLDFETQPSYSVRVRGTDLNGLAVDQVFALSITDLNDAPVDIALSSSEVGENLPIGTLVGLLSSSDPDAADTHTYSLVAGDGSTDNASFTIVGNELRTSEVFVQATKSTYTIRVRSTDDEGLFTEEIFTITVIL